MAQHEIREGALGVPDWHKNYTLWELEPEGGILEGIDLLNPDRARVMLAEMGYSENMWEDFSGHGSHETRALIITARGALDRSATVLSLRLRFEDGFLKGDKESHYLLFTPSELAAEGLKY